MNPGKAMAVAVLLAHAVAGQAAGDRDQIAALIAALADESTRADAQDALLQLGDRPTDLLVSALHDAKPDVADAELDRYGAILAVLTRMGRDARSGFPMLGDTLRRLPDELGPSGLRAYAELAYWSVEDPGSVRPFWSPVPPHAVQLDFVEDGVRYSVGASGDRDLLLELHRAECRLRAPRQPSFDDVRSMLVSTSLPDVELALELLVGFGAEARSLLPRVHPIVRGELGGDLPYADLMRFKAARAVAELAPDDPHSSLAHAYLAVHHHDPGVRSRSALAAGVLAGDSPDCVPYLIEALSDRRDAVRREAVTALGTIGGAAGDAIPALEQLAGHADQQIAERARVALRQIRDRVEDMLPGGDREVSMPAPDPVDCPEPHPEPRCEHWSRRSASRSCWPAPVSPSRSSSPARSGPTQTATTPHPA